MDYYDEQKFANLKNSSRSSLATLYQASGMADDKQGFLNVTKTPDGILFSSAVQGATLNASLVEAVAAQPYHISVLQVSDIIEVPGIDNAGAPRKAPAPPQPVKAPAKSPAKVPAPSKDEQPATPPSAGASPAESLREGPATADAPASGAVPQRIHVAGLRVVLGLAAGMLAF